MEELSGHRILVVGTARGIGASIASEVAARGATVACLDRNAEGAERVAASLRGRGATSLSAAMDVTDPDQVEAGIEGVVHSLGGLDSVVYAAGVTTTAPLEDLSLTEWRRVLAVNLDGAFLVARSSLRHLSGGTLVFVGSQLARAAVPQKAAYIASKGALESLTRALAVEFADRDVRVNCLAPGPTRTGMLLDRLGDDPEGLQSLADRVPLRRLADPEEIARAAAYLVGPGATFMSGTTLVVDGGYQAQ